MEHIKEVRRFVEEQPGVSNVLSQSLRALEEFIMTKQLQHRKQLKISSFFQNNKIYIITFITLL